jgi:type VI secretion system Hcp family effector
VALNIYVQLAINGQPLSGSVSIATMGGVDVSVNHIEAHGFYHELVALSGDRGVMLKPAPITFTKRIDNTTPRLMQAWAQGQTIDAAFKFFDRHPDDGSVRPLQVYVVQQGTITAVRTEMMSNLLADGANAPVLERVTVAYRSFRVDHVPSSQTWSASLSSVA